MNNYIPFISAASALFAAVVAQCLNNWFTYRRENKKHLKEIYEQFISPFFFEFMSFYESRCHPRGGMDKKNDDKIDREVNSLFIKAHLANGEFQLLILEKQRLRFVEDVRDGDKEKLNIKICYFYLRYCRYILRKIKFPLSLNVKYQLNDRLKSYAFWYLLAENCTYEESINTMASFLIFNLNTLDRYSVRQIDKMIIKGDINSFNILRSRVENEIKKHI